MPRNAGPTLLDDNRLTGLVDAQVRLRPLRPLRLVPEGKTALFRAEVQAASETWGGGGHPMLAITSDRLPTQLLREIERAEIESVGGLVVPDLSTVPRRLPYGPPRGFPLVAVLGAEERKERPAVRIPGRRSSGREVIRQPTEEIVGTPAAPLMREEIAP